MNRLWILTAPIVLAAFTASAFAQMAPVKTGTSTAGKVLTNEQGMTLYTFDKDTDGKSVCSGTCAVNWPPLAAAANAKPGEGYSIISRDDGSKQWAYKGKPLYTWKKDEKPGDITGNGLANGSWHVAQP